METNKYIDWDEAKNQHLRTERDICFEDVVTAIGEGRVLDDVRHPGKLWKHQKILIVEIDDYVYLVPYVENEEKIFLKTIYPSRKFTKVYLKGESK